MTDAGAPPAAAAYSIQVMNLVSHRCLIASFLFSCQLPLVAAKLPALVGAVAPRQGMEEAETTVPVVAVVSRQQTESHLPPLPLLSLSRSDTGLPAGWKLVGLPRRRPTRYEVVEIEGRSALRASGRDAAAAMLRAVRFDPMRRPLLRWQWRVEATIAQRNAAKKHSDDYAARIFVIFADGDRDDMERPSLREHRTLCYVWSSDALRPETMFTSPYADNVAMLVVRSGDQRAGEWVDESRDLRADFLLAFGEQPGDVIGIAVMSDSDDTNREATAYYAGIEILAAR